MYSSSTTEGTPHGAHQTRGKVWKNAFLGVMDIYEENMTFS